MLGRDTSVTDITIERQGGKRFFLRIDGRRMASGARVRELILLPMRTICRNEFSLLCAYGWNPTNREHFQMTVRRGRFEKSLSALVAHHILNLVRQFFRRRLFQSLTSGRLRVEFANRQTVTIRTPGWPDFHSMAKQTLVTGRIFRNRFPDVIIAPCLRIELWQRIRTQ